MNFYCSPCDRYEPCDSCGGMKRIGIWDRLGFGPNCPHPWGSGFLLGWGTCASGVAIGLVLGHVA